MKGATDAMEIHWRNAQTIEPEHRSVVEARIEELARENGDLIDVRIAIDEGLHHRQGAKTVRIACQARGAEIVSTRTADAAALALDLAVDVFEREVRKARRVKLDRRTRRPQQPPHLGIIDRILLEEGYGFVLTDDGERVYFHRNAVHGGLDFESLGEGQRVALNYEAGREGLQATALVPPPPDASTP